MPAYEYSPRPRTVPEVFLGVYWGGVTLSAIFLAASICIRLRVFKRLFPDDYLVLAGWLMFLSSAVIWQFQVHGMYDTERASSGSIPVDLTTLPTRLMRYLRSSLAVLILFYTSLYFVKFAFLIFFRRLGNRVKGQNILWWIVATITVLAWLAMFATIDYQCFLDDWTNIFAKCTTPEAVYFQKWTLDFNMSIDVVTDVLIMSIPISMMWKVKISLRQKIALISIFSLTILTIIFAIVRVAVINAYSVQPDQMWLYMWCSVEQTIAILVACLVSFRVLFTSLDKRSSRNRLVPGDASSKNLRSGLTWFPSRSNVSSEDVSLPTPGVKISGGGVDSTDSTYGLVELDGIHVSTAFSTTSHPRDEFCSDLGDKPRF